MKFTKILIAVLMLFTLASQVNAENLQLNYIHFDPAIIAAGDEVDIVIQFADTNTPVQNGKVSNTDYKFEVRLEADDALTEKYVIIQDEKGDDLKGTIFSGDTYYKNFRVKVLNNAPSGNYEFKLTGQYYYKGIAEDITKELKFTMPVKKEGIILDVANIITIPSEVRAGDDYIQIKASIENSGNKDAKSIELILTPPPGFEASYANNNRVWVGSLATGEKKEVTFTVDVDDNIKSGIYDFQYNFNYMDLDDNSYEKISKIPFMIKPRSYLEITKYEGSGLAGSTGELRVWVKNTGDESAESIDVRIIKESSQEFDFDVRTNYIGELEPGEEGLAIFDIKANSGAKIKEHDFKIVLRSKGDSDKGDENIYTYSRRAKYEITGVAPNYFKTVGIALAIVILLIIILNKVSKQRSKQKRVRKK